MSYICLSLHILTLSKVAVVGGRNEQTQNEGARKREEKEEEKEEEGVFSSDKSSLDDRKLHSRWQRR
jgi:hypothetical protein